MSPSISRRLIALSSAVVIVGSGVGWKLWHRPAAQPPVAALHEEAASTPASTAPVVPAPVAQVPPSAPVAAEPRLPSTPRPASANPTILLAANATPAPATPSPRAASADRPEPQQSDAPAKPSVADVLSAPGLNMADPNQRLKAVEQVRATENEKRAAVNARADQLGIPKRVVKPDGRIVELVDFKGEEPVYLSTHNANASISTAANLVAAAPYSVNGAGFTVGVWDGGAVRSTHQELTGRVTVKDGSQPADHSTHVGGTIGASGVVAAAKGMATGVKIDSYDWTNDRSEMLSRGASYPGEPGTIYLSNHSYGYISGWDYTGYLSPMWQWYGNTTTKVEDDFGRYSTYSRDTDSVAASLPYYLIFRAAGNERNDDPAKGDPVSLSFTTSAVVSYDPAIHPLGDSVYKGGYDLIEGDALAKNVVTIAAAADAVTSGSRVVAKATPTSFTSWGPSDDGRVKPDLVANGFDLYSSIGTGNTAYGTYSGTSMASPNAMGSAALLVSFFDKLFPGQAMRASTLKALLIETADDLGPVGPDYQNGWGLINTKAAADLIQAYKTAPGTRRMIEDKITTSRTSITESFTYSGSGPIRATLCWTDPAGSATTATGDVRTAKLVNNLNLKLIGPNSVTYSPYVLPYVGDWSAAKLATAATTGVNNTDNVEQVYIAAPPAGTYQAVVTYSGTLSGGSQIYSLILAGGGTTDTAVAPTLTAISPTSTAGGSITVTLTSANARLGATVKFTKTGQGDVAATGVEVQGDTVRVRLTTNGMLAGAWNAVITNPDGKSATLANALTIAGAQYSDQLEGSVTGWTHTAALGSDTWSLTSANSHSATHSFYTPAQATKQDDSLVSPAISIPAGSSNLQLTFWHTFNLQSGQDGGVIEFSIDGGAYFGVNDTGSGTTFVSGAYNSTISSAGTVDTRSVLAGKSAWSGVSNTWTQVAVNFTNATKFAGHTLRIRWRLGTNSSVASDGWYVDDIAIGAAGSANLAPSIATPANASASILNGTSVSLSVTATDDAAEASLQYSWTVNDNITAPIQFSENGNNLAKNTVAKFSQSGLFNFNVSARDTGGLVATSSVEVQVEQALTSIKVTPFTGKVGVGDSLQLTAAGLDQFGKPMNPALPITWGVAAGASIDATGLFTAGPIPGGPISVTAAYGSVSANVGITITGATYQSWQNQKFTSTEISSGLAADTYDIDGDGIANLAEYALGTDPKVTNTFPAAEISTESDGLRHLSVTYTRPRALPSVGYNVGFTSNFSTWSPATVEILYNTDTTETLKATDPVSVDGNTQRFMHLEIVRQTP